MRFIILVLSILFLASCKTEPEPLVPAKLLFIDNFDSENLNSNKWYYRQLNNHRGDSYVTKDAVNIVDSCLKIMVFSEPEGAGFKHFSGMISTEKSFNSKFGYFEARILFSSIPGMWSAFWIQSPLVTSTSLPYEKAGVEIDVVEHRAIDKDGFDIKNLLAHTLHWGGYGTNHQQKKYRQDNMGLTTGFHTYAVEWTDEKYSFYLDGKLTQTWTRKDNVPISQTTQYIILSTETQDAGWAGNIPTNGFGNALNTKAYMLVDWIKVYDKKPF